MALPRRATPLTFLAENLVRGEFRKWDKVEPFPWFRRRRIANPAASSIIHNRGPEIAVQNSFCGRIGCQQLRHASVEQVTMIEMDVRTDLASFAGACLEIHGWLGHKVRTGSAFVAQYSQKNLAGTLNVCVETVSNKYA
jgi:hypothetical protein